MTDPEPRLTIIGGGLAGCEAAWQAASRGVRVQLYEMRPARGTPAHQTDRLAELVCSNSLGSLLPDRALGVLKNEMRALGCLILEIAQAVAVPAGNALAVSRDDFADRVTAAIGGHSLIEVHREEVTDIPGGPCIVATGPLTSDALAERIHALTGAESLYFYDAMAPIVEASSIDMTVAFRQGRYDLEKAESPPDPADATGDYINCPLDREQYEAFVDAVLAAPRSPVKSFEREQERFFEGCMPIEVLAARGREALAFGPMRPVGLIDPRTGRRPHAVVQLRQDNLAATLYNIVGFQTNLRWGAQEDVLRMLPGLEHAEFVRLGQMHRNTFINSPTLLEPTLQFRGSDGADVARRDLFFAGQVTGTEGYVGSTLGGLVAGLNVVRLARGESLLTFPRETMTGALLHYITHAEPKSFQPMKANLGLLPPLDKPPVDATDDGKRRRRRESKRDRHRRLTERALATMRDFLEQAGHQPVPVATPASEGR